MRGYSNIAGGGPSLSRTERAYEEIRSFNRPYGNVPPAPEAKVLRLDLKTRKVKVVTKVVKPKALAPATKAGIKLAPAEVEEDDAVRVFVDPTDDGFSARTGLTRGALPVQAKPARPFQNPFMDCYWVAEVLPATTTQLSAGDEPEVGSTSTPVVPPAGEKKKRKMINKKTKTGEIIV